MYLGVVNKCTLESLINARKISQGLEAKGYSFLLNKEADRTLSQ